MEPLKKKRERRLSIIIAFILLSLIVNTNFSYAEDASIPAYFNLEADVLDFTITSSVNFSGKQHDTDLTITPIVVTNNSTDQYLKITQVAYSNTSSNLTLVSKDTDFNTAGSEYSLVMNGCHDFSSGTYVHDRPILLNGGTNTLYFTGKIGKNSTPFTNEPCGNFIVTIEKTTLPYYQSYKVTSLRNVKWTTGSTKEVKAVLEAAYDGVIDIETYCGWKIGDERTIALSSFNTQYNKSKYDFSGGTTSSMQTTLVLLNKGGEYLTTGQECQYVVGFKDAVCYEGYDVPDKASGYTIGDAYNDYEGSVLDQTCTNIYNALPSPFNEVFKEWQVYVNAPTTITQLESGYWVCDNKTIKKLNRYCVAPALNNIYTETEKGEMNANVVDAEKDYVKTRYTYFATEANRKKVIQLTAATSCGWWLRTPLGCDKASDSFTARAVNKNGYVSSYNKITEYNGLAPVLCI